MHKLQLKWSIVNKISNLDRERRLSTVDLHVLTNVDQLIFLLKILFISFTKQATLVGQAPGWCNWNKWFYTLTPTYCYSVGYVLFSWGRHDTQHNDIQYNGIQHSNKNYGTALCSTGIWVSFCGGHLCWVSLCRMPLCRMSSRQVVM